MALYNTKGKVCHIEITASGVSKAGNDWKRVTIVIESPGYQGAFVRQAFTAINDWADYILQNISEGMEVEIAFSVSSREWDGRWFTDVQVCRINPADLYGKQEHTPQAAPQAQSRRSPIYEKIADASKQGRVQVGAVAPSNDESLEPQADDLPF